MSTAITFLSGKGGSGKTTLALGIADLLCKSNIKTLLVDCDLSTNGATYFYESQLHEQNMSSACKISSFYNILYQPEYVGEFIPLNIGTNMDFIPSVSEISESGLTGGRPQHTDRLAYNLTKFLDWARGDYDVILFDCQAGYSEFLPQLLPLVDADLFVLEADSISASAMRSLHLKVGNSLGRARLYQVFNKATPEEFEIYSKIVGTFFTNIGTLLFDWKIRQAFSRSQVPDFEKTSVQYGLDLCDICKIIFLEKETHRKIAKFSSQLLDKKLEEAESEIRSQLERLNRKAKRVPATVLSLLTLLTSVLALCIYYSVISGNAVFAFKYDSFWFMLFIPAVVVLSIFGFIFSADDSLHERREQRRIYQKQLQKLQEKRFMLKAGIVTPDNSTS